MLTLTQLNRIPDPQTRQIVQNLANLLEQSLTNIDLLKQQNQLLQDEINRLKGEQGKPNIKPNKQNQDNPDNPDTQDNTDHSSEKKRHQPKLWSKDTKNDKIVIHRTQRLSLDTATLPPDAIFKGYEPVIVQNLLLTLENVCFERAKYYAPSTAKTYLAPLPPGYHTHYGPDLKALVLGLHHLGNVSQPALHTFLTQTGIHISAGQVSNLLVEGQEDFHQEKGAIGLAGLESSPWQQTDDTTTRVNGVNHHCHVLGNPLYTRYTTLPKKDRLSVLEVLTNGAERRFLLTAQGLASEAVSKMPRKWQRVLATFPQDILFSEEVLLEWLDTQMPTLAPRKRKGLLEQMALAAYGAQTQVPRVSLLLCDDAPQFRGLTPELALCWVHDARHYQKLLPHLRCHRECLEAFQDKYWDYYDRLLAYREAPSLEEGHVLWEAFDRLFVANTGYAHLDYRIQQTAHHKAQLLRVLLHPEIPLHNNASELAVRRRVRKRDVSFGPRSPEGVAAWDTFQTIGATAQKLGVSFLAYLKDRVSGSKQMPSLASLITQRAAELNLGASWT